MSDYIRMDDGREIPVYQYIRELSAERDALRGEVAVLRGELEWMSNHRDLLIDESPKVTVRRKGEQRFKIVSGEIDRLRKAANDEPAGGE